MIRRPVLLCAAAIAAVWMLAGAPSAFSSPPGPTVGGRNRYDHCLALVQRDASGAYAQATGWFAAGGGPAALHCEALALVGLKRYAEAAQKLEAAAAGESKAAASLRAELFDQAGNAWLLDGEAGKADFALTSALALEPKDEDLLADRARARGVAKNWTGAFEDLTAVLAIDPARADVYVLRASALHAQGRKAEARADLAHALDIYPGYPEALVERGTMRLEGGDRDGARADWQEAAKEAPDSDAGDAARARLNALAAASRAPKR